MEAAKDPTREEHAEYFVFVGGPVLPFHGSAAGTEDAGLAITGDSPDKFCQLTDQERSPIHRAPAILVEILRLLQFPCRGRVKNLVGLRYRYVVQKMERAGIDFKGLGEEGRELLNEIMAELEDSGEDNYVLVVIKKLLQSIGGMLGG
ncbi:unnamed protein product [Tuber aestivum]|uniref:Uncharacterized protein n=1 Tax=Tuber aestivum TaxID=59557 RepID=A0A292PKR6_9PEZI|nr:unnamed protein product [Tuber aestivum]